MFAVYNLLHVNHYISKKMNPSRNVPLWIGRCCTRFGVLHISDLVFVCFYKV